MGCPHCMEYTNAFTLEKGGRGFRGLTVIANSYKNITSRRNKNDFKKDERVTYLSPPRLSPGKVWNNVCELPKFTDNGKAYKIQGYWVTHNWKKISIFWNLPYEKSSFH